MVFPISGLEHRIVWYLANNVSDEHAASMFKIKLKIKGVSDITTMSNAKII